MRHNLKFPAWIGDLLGLKVWTAHRAFDLFSGETLKCGVDNILFIYTTVHAQIRRHLVHAGAGCLRVQTGHVRLQRLPDILQPLGVLQVIDDNIPASRHANRIGDIKWWPIPNLKRA